MTADAATTPDPFRLDGRSVLVTGAGGGIGTALVAAFRRAGALVAAADRTEALIAQLDVPYRLAFEITDAAACRAALEAHIAAHGAPDILVNNAGFTRGETLDMVDGALWRREIDLNLTGAYNVTAPVMSAMAARGSGAIVFTASVNALAHFGNPAYSAAKAGLIAYARAIAVEAGADGIRANVVCPGSVRTPAWDHRIERDPGVVADVLAHYPLGRMVSPADVANATVFLASDAAAGITGAVLAVDGGLTAGSLPFVRDIIERRS